MFRFEHPIYLYGFVLLPVLAVFFLMFWQWRKRAMNRFGNRTLMEQLMPGISNFKHLVKFCLLLLALAFLIVGWANPQWGSKREKVKRKSADVFIALDISTSMYAEDVAPNRLERAKKFTESLIDALKGERIGLILFAGGAYLQAPLTTDYTVVKLFIRSASPDLAGTQGSSIASAIDAARQSFPEDNTTHKALIIITDGEDHNPEELKAAAKRARESGLMLFAVGFGTPQGSFIPILIDGREDYKRDETGQPVRSKLNEDALIELAQIGGGAYYPATQGDGVLAGLRASIDRLEKQDLEMRAFTTFNSYFQYFIAAGLLLLLIEFSISYRKKKWLERKDIFS